MPNTDDLLKEIEQEVETVYRTAKKEIGDKWDKYMNEMGKKTKDLYAQYEQAKKAGENKLADDLLYEYKRNVQNMTLQDARYRSMVKETSEQLAHVNETALNVVNGKMGQVYTLSYNELNQDLKGAKIGGYSFSLVDQATVDNLINNGGNLFPDPLKRTLKEILQKSLDVGKDVTWNKKLINSQVLQGILQGESVGKIAGRLQNVSDMNSASAIRNARTMTTNAENKGRLDSYKKAENDGIIMKKVWLATIDDRTRVQHMELDGEERDIDDPFTIDGYSIMYPGDPSASPAMVYNCRCTLKTKIVGFKSKNGAVNAVEDYSKDGMRVVRNADGDSVLVTKAEAEKLKDGYIGEGKKNKSQKAKNQKQGIEYHRRKIQRNEH